jgi:hypothetical protein
VAPLKEACHIVQPIAEVQADFDEVVVLALHLHQVWLTCDSTHCIASRRAVARTAHESTHRTHALILRLSDFWRSSSSSPPAKVSNLHSQAYTPPSVHLGTTSQILIVFVCTPSLFKPVGSSSMGSGAPAHPGRQMSFAQCTIAVIMARSATDSDAAGLLVHRATSGVPAACLISHIAHLSLGLHAELHDTVTRRCTAAQRLWAGST